jgi:hypothetical protein
LQQLAKEQERQNLLQQAKGKPHTQRPAAYEMQVKRMRELGLIGNSSDPKSMERYELCKILSYLLRS